MAGMMIAAGRETVAADSYTGIGLQDNQDCSLQVSMVFTDAYNEAAPVPISGAELSLVKAADLKADGSYELTEPFADIASMKTYISGNGTSSDARMAADEAAAAAAEADGAVKEVTDSSGTAVFTVKDYGIYLLYETGKTGTAAKYGSIQPMLTSLPAYTEENGWQYDTEVLPKFNADTGTSVRIRKRAGMNGQTTDEKVIGAKLQIVRSSDEAIIDEWTTTDVDHDALIPEPGDYILSETEAPDGYQRADPISFTVTEEGAVKVNGEAMDNNEIIMEDPKETVKQELPKTDDNPSDNSGLKHRLPVVSALAEIVETGVNSHPYAWVLTGTAACVLFFIIHKLRKHKGKISD